jgi:hypothetical protein
MKPETKLKTWLDHARAGTDAELTDAARLWVLVQKPLLDRGILKDLEPIPDKRFDSARTELEDLINAYLEKHDAKFLLGFEPDGTASVEIEHFYNNDPEKAWHDFIDYLQYNKRSDWRVCEHCGSAFEVKKGTPKYCSESCRSMAYRKRKAEKEGT